jgi:hypothetical protein
VSRGIAAGSGGLRALLLGAALLVGLGTVAACEPTLHQDTGLVVDIQQSSLTAIEGFRLRTTDGRVVEFATLTTRFDAAFPVQHLGEHLALAQPITVTYKVVDGRNEVVRLADAEAR